MGFFDLPEGVDDDDEEDDESESPFEDMRPARWIAGVLPLELVVARTDEGAVIAQGIRVLPDGFELRLTWVLRRRRPRRRWTRRPGVGRMSRPQYEDDPMDDLRFGMTWPDGGRAVLDEGWHAGPDATDPAHGLESRSGGGSDMEYHQDVWAYPVPDMGDVTLVCEWLTAGIPETHTTLDGDLLRAAATRARPVWDEDTGSRSFVSRSEMMARIRSRHQDGSGSQIVNE